MVDYSIMGFHLGRKDERKVTILALLKLGVFGYMSASLFAMIGDKTAFGIWIIMGILFGLAMIEWILSCHFLSLGIEWVASDRDKIHEEEGCYEMVQKMC